MSGADNIEQCLVRAVVVFLLVRPKSVRGEERIDKEITYSKYSYIKKKVTENHIAMLAKKFCKLQKYRDEEKVEERRENQKES
jgi:hypothetical protein